MQYVPLGRSGLMVSRLCLGTTNFGPLTSEADSHAIMDKALELGINFLDTADIYGQRKGEGWTEQIVGRWLGEGDRRRERLVLATKCFDPMGDSPNDRGLSAYHIRRACDDSLRRLRTDHIDLYQMHHVDRATPWEEIWQAMEQLVRQGKILYVGSSNFAAWHVARANEAAARRRFLGLVSEQCKYNLASRLVELELLPACARYGLGVMPWSPLDAGFLGGVLKATNVRRRGSDAMRRRVENARPRLARWEEFCAHLGETPANVALAWVLSNPVVTAPILGPRTVEQLTGVMRAMEITLDEAARRKLDEIWPGPGGSAGSGRPG